VDAQGAGLPNRTAPRRLDRRSPHIQREVKSAVGIFSRRESANGTENSAKRVTKQAGDLELAIPKLRAGSFIPSLLERRRRIDQGL